jgi:hypothetical protein
MCAPPALYLAHVAVKAQEDGNGDQAQIRENSDAIVRLQAEVVASQKQMLEIDLRVLEVQRQQLIVQRSLVVPASRTAKGVEELIRLTDEQLKATRAALDFWRKKEREGRTDVARREPRNSGEERGASEEWPNFGHRSLPKSWWDERDRNR